MCFFVDGKNNKVQTADKDIVCWKKLIHYNGMFHSGICEFVYEKGKLYKRKCLKKSKYKSGYELKMGFHSYINKSKANSMSDFWGVITKKFIIPKGARYLENKIQSEYISNQIIMK